MKSSYIYIALTVVLIGGLILVRNYSNSSDAVATTEYDTFAQCVGDAGAKFYGAYWCPHCQEQKKLFKNSKKLPYIECSTPNGQAQTQVCIDEKITGYPTWKFADGSIGDGLQTLEELAEKTSCALPVIAS
jgi:thiol-disulfide isomerase/thioredoxin